MEELNLDLDLESTELKTISIPENNQQNKIIKENYSTNNLTNNLNDLNLNSEPTDDFGLDLLVNKKKQKSENKQLDKKMDILTGRQAFKNMLRVLKNKNANQQTDFVADLVNNLDVKGQLSTLFKKIRDKKKSK